MEILFACLGAAIGAFLAYEKIQHNVAAQLQHRGWVDATGLDSYYPIYGFLGWVVGVLVYSLGKFVLRIYHRARS